MLVALDFLPALRPLPLRHLNRRNAEALLIAKQFADALEVAHGHGIIPRDLKPANIKVRLDGTVKVTRLRLAKSMKPASTMGASAMNSRAITTAARTLLRRWR
jgi:serine/threonine protein kinase